MNLSHRARKTHVSTFSQAHAVLIMFACFLPLRAFLDLGKPE